MIQTYVSDRLLGVARQEFEKRLQLKAVPSRDPLVQQVDDEEHQKGLELSIRFSAWVDGEFRVTTCHMGRGILNHPNIDAIMCRAGVLAARDIRRNLHALPTDPQH